MRRLRGCGYLGVGRLWLIRSLFTSDKVASDAMVARRKHRVVKRCSQVRLCKAVADEGHNGRAREMEMRKRVWLFCEGGKKSSKLTFCKTADGLYTNRLSDRRTP